MDTTQPLALLGGLSPATFMRRHWQRRPLLVRAAVPDFRSPLARADLFALAARDDVESRLVRAEGRARWALRNGPFARRALPPLRQPRWTLLVQGVDLHVDAAHAFLNRFRFVPDARLDDLMVSYATDGGGVGPHVDSYDVFLFQASGRRRWRIGRQADLRLQPDVPLKILRHFEPEAEYELGPGDMLYLPPRYAHEGVAVGGDCSTWSIGFRAPTRDALGAEMLQRLALDGEEGAGRLYRDGGQRAVDAPAAIPPELARFAGEAVARAAGDATAIARALGEYLTEPKSQVWFERNDPDVSFAGMLRLDRRTRMMYDAQHVFINGESYRAQGRDARILRVFADSRLLPALECTKLGEDARALLREWCEGGWIHGE